LVQTLSAQQVLETVEEFTPIVSEAEVIEIGKEY